MVIQMHCLKFLLEYLVLVNFKKSLVNLKYTNHSLQILLIGIAIHFF